ncbi:MAG: DUF72 domain-containing protein [Candidatus Hodarchaeota archaeon]
MVKITVGTAGWDYKDWIGPFYPKKLYKSQQLEYFSKFFNFVEINSTFYNLPAEDIVINWKHHVPENFRFIVKVWQQITHHLEDPHLESNIINFFSKLKHLKPKIEAFLLQFPPWFRYSENNVQKLKLLLNKIPLEYKYIIELRDNSWFNPKILIEFTDGNQKILGTTYMPGLTPYYMQNQKFYYIRLIGDRKLTVFNRIQRHQKKALNSFYMGIQDINKIPNVYEIFIIVNNHFQGFAPESVNELKKKFGLPYRKFSNQKRLSEFF